MNSLYQQLNGNQFGNNLSAVKSMLNSVRSSTNPSAVLQNMMSRNPQLQQVMNLVRQSGGDPKSAFYKLAEQKGVDPEQVLNALR